MSKANIAKKKNLKGWKKVAAIAGGAALGAVNPFKVVKAKPKQTVVAKKSTQEAFKKATAKKTAQTVKKQQKKVKVACFTAGTKIHTEKAFKNIEAIKVGDYVWSENPETKEKALKKVKKIFVREKDSIIRLAINGEVIETTDEHPFYVEGRGFTEAKWLEAGDEVRLATGNIAEVDTIESVQLDTPVKVYNFEVEDFHTYYVSGQKVLVHNTCAKPVQSQTNVVTSTTQSRTNVATGTVWDNIKATQERILGTNIPKSFEMSAGGIKVWVHPNATKHLAEYSKSHVSHGQPMIEQQLLSSLHGAIDRIIKNGYEYDKLAQVDDWEIIISPPGRTGPLPVIKHALYKP